MKGALDKLLDEFSIKTIPISTRKTSVRAMPFSANYATDMPGNGEHHLRLILRTMKDTDNLAGGLYSESLTAMSQVILSHPEWVDDATRWFEVFDEIDLKLIRDAAGRYNVAPKPAAMAVLIAHTISTRLG